MNNKLKITVWASIGLMAVALLITQSIWLAAFKGEDHSTMSDRAIVGLVFSVLGLAAVLGAGVYAHKNMGELNKNTLLILAVAFVFLLIGAAVPMDDQRKIWDLFDAMPSAIKDAAREQDATAYAAMQMFPASLTFLLAGSLGFLGSVAFGIHKHEFDL